MQLPDQIEESAPPGVSCRHCGYDLAGAPSNLCPECGRSGPDPFPAVRTGVRWLAAFPPVVSVIVAALWFSGVLDGVQSGATSVGLSDGTFWAVIVFSVLGAIAPWAIGWMFITSRPVRLAFAGCERAAHAASGLTVLLICSTLAWAASLPLALVSSPMGLLPTLAAAAGGILIPIQCIAVHSFVVWLGRGAGSLLLERAARRARAVTLTGGFLCLIIAADTSDRYNHEVVRHWIVIAILVMIAMGTEARMLILLCQVARRRRLA